MERLHAHDVDAGEKREIAKRRLKELWESDFPKNLSVQVLQESHVNLIRKGVTLQVARETVSDYLAWQVIDNDRGVFVQALDEQSRWQLSFWDASILAAARRGGAGVIWSENFSDGQDYGGVAVVNPLAGATAGSPATLPEEGA